LLVFISLIREMPHKKDRLKLSLPAFTASGIFKDGRKKENLVSHTGIIQIDIDDIPNPSEIKEKLSKDPFTYIAFISPSGKGLKLIVKIPSEIEKHEYYFNRLLDYYKINYNLIVDERCKDITRLCFLSSDPSIYVNNESFEFNDTNRDVFFAIDYLCEQKQDITLQVIIVIG